MTSSDSRVTFEVTDTEVVMTVRDSRKKDQGKYSIVLKNEKGQDTATVNVIVQGQAI